MYCIKHKPKDFIVEEVSTIKPKEAGKFLYFKLKKKNYGTLDAIKKLVSSWNVPVKNIAYAGLKDRRAITTQVCSVKGVSGEKIQQTSLENIECTVLGFGDEPVHVGDLEGNNFTIVLRKLEKVPEIKARFRNLFGKQRFSENNAEIGRAIVRKNFELAVKLALAQDERFKEKMQPYIEKKNWVAALKCVPFKLLRLYVHAYQSWLWNEAAKRTEKDELPLVGFGTQEVDEHAQELLEREGITPRDFIIKELPDISAEGDVRGVWQEAQNLTISKPELDDEHEGKKKIILSFFLQKGSYATEFVAWQFR